MRGIIIELFELFLIRKRILLTSLAILIPLLMDKQKLNILLTVILVLGSLLAFPSSLDHKSMTNIDDSLNRALQSFALARSLNAVISAAQGTEISVEPLGLGVTFTPGQVLDPVNDLIERFSWIMLVSSTSIGMQKIFLEISTHPGIKQVLIFISFERLFSSFFSILIAAVES